MQASQLGTRSGAGLEREEEKQEEEEEKKKEGERGENGHIVSIAQDRKERILGEKKSVAFVQLPGIFAMVFLGELTASL